MRFVAIIADQKVVQEIEAEEIWQVYPTIGLTALQLDHSVVSPGVGIVVYELGMFVPPKEQHYFSFGHKLYAGNAVLYGFDAGGDSIDLKSYPVPTFFGSWLDVEMAIGAGRIVRPRLTVNGVEHWAWPQSRVM